MSKAIYPVILVVSGIILCLFQNCSQPIFSGSAQASNDEGGGAPVQAATSCDLDFSIGNLTVSFDMNLQSATGIQHIHSNTTTPGASFVYADGFLVGFGSRYQGSTFNTLYVVPHLQAHQIVCIIDAHDSNIEYSLPVGTPTHYCNYSGSFVSSVPQHRQLVFMTRAPLYTGDSVSGFQVDQIRCINGNGQNGDEVRVGNVNAAFGYQIAASPL